MDEKRDFLIYKENLQLGYKEVFEQVEHFLNSKNFTEDEAADILNDLLDTLLTAQQNGKTVESVVGNDFMAFCEKYTECCIPGEKENAKEQSHIMKMIFGEEDIESITALFLNNIIYKYEKINRQRKNKSMELIEENSFISQCLDKRVSQIGLKKICVIIAVAVLTSPLWTSYSAYSEKWGYLLFLFCILSFLFTWYQHEKDMEEEKIAFLEKIKGSGVSMYQFQKWNEEIKRQRFEVTNIHAQIE